MRSLTTLHAMSYKRSRSSVEVKVVAWKHCITANYCSLYVKSYGDIINYDWKLPNNSFWSMRSIQIRPETAHYIVGQPQVAMHSKLRHSFKAIMSVFRMCYISLLLLLFCIVCLMANERNYNTTQLSTGSSPTGYSIVVKMVQNNIQIFRTFSWHFRHAQCPRECLSGVRNTSCGVLTIAAWMHRKMASLGRGGRGRTDRLGWHHPGGDTWIKLFFF